jgi:hypothetical protein
MYRRLRPTVTFHITVFWTTSRRKFGPWNLPGITAVTVTVLLCHSAQWLVKSRQINYWHNTVSQKSKVQATIWVVLVCHSTITQLPSKHTRHLHPTTQFNIKCISFSNHNKIKLHFHWLMNQTSINMWNPSNTHIFQLTRNNKTGLYLSLTVPLAVSDRSLVHRARLKERNSSHRSVNQVMMELCYRKYNRSARLSLGGRCMLCPTNCANLCAYWNRKHGEVTNCVGRTEHQAMWTPTYTSSYRICNLLKKIIFTLSKFHAINRPHRFFFVVAPCISIISKFFWPKNAQFFNHIKC